MYVYDCGIFFWQMQGREIDLFSAFQDLYLVYKECIKRES